MPIQPTYPGVYIQEASSGVRTITGVSTSIAAFLGRTAKGPLNKAVRCLSYSDFLREFGGGHPLSELGASTRQFFDNGGTDCYVVRLAKMPTGTTGQASVTLKNLAGTSVEILTATAKAGGVWGQDLKLEVNYNTPNPEDTFNLLITQETNGSVVNSELHSNLSMQPKSPRFAPTFVTQSSQLIDLTLHSTMGDPTSSTSFINDTTNTPLGFSESRRVFTGADDTALAKNISDEINKLANTDSKSKFLINVDGKQDIEIDLAGITMPATPSATNIASKLEGVLNPKVSAAVPAASVGITIKTFTIVDPADSTKTLKAGVLRITAVQPDSWGNITIGRVASSDFAGPMMLGIDQGGVEVARYSNLRPVPNGIIYAGGTGFGDLTAGTNGLNTFAGLLQKDINKIVFDKALTTIVTVNADLRTRLPVATDSPNFIDAAGGNNGVIEKLQIIKQAVNSDPNSPCTAELWGYRLVFKKKSGSINDSSTVATEGTASASPLGLGFTKNTRRYSLGTLGTSTFQSGGAAGSDGVAPGQAEYEGDPRLHTGFYALDKVDLFNLMVLPFDSEVDLTPIRARASSYCEERRAFLLLDAPKDWVKDDHPAADATDVNNFRNGLSKKYSAVFFPKVQYSEAGLKKYIGPSGMIAGLMARTDSQRGVWKAPAGIEADLRGVLDVELNLTDNENGGLNKLGVNCIRKFPNGIVNWGARTLDGSDDFSSEWKYIPIRRLALFLEESLYRGTQWVVFEPNDEPLWAKIRMNLNAFMMSLFKQGAFQGSTPDKAFYVKCDGETTTANDRNLGIVNIQVGFAPLKPAEFVVITIQQIPDV